MGENKRLQLLQELEMINKKLGFIGDRGISYMTDNKLEKLIKELKKKIKDYGNKN